MLDPLAHLQNLPIYPTGRRIAEGDERFWAAGREDGTSCVFVDCDEHLSSSGLGEVLSSIVVHLDRDYPRRLIFRLEDLSLIDKFHTVFVAIAHEASNVDGDSLAKHIIGQIIEWATFLMPKRQGVSEEKLRGLWGELLLLQRHFCGRFRPEEVVEGYAGIHEAPQDLVGKDFSIEVKTTIKRAPSTVSISSLEQLDARTPNQLLVLLLISQDEKGVSINELVKEIDGFLGENLRQRLLFQKLLADALNGASIEQLEDKYSVLDQISWEIQEGFPALRRSTVNPAVQRAEYSLAIHQLNGFILQINIGDWIDGIRSTRI